MKENKAIKYFEAYSEIMNYFEKELMYYRAKVKQIRQKKKSVAFKAVNDKGIADDLIMNYKGAVKKYVKIMKEIKEVFNPEINPNNHIKYQIERNYGRLAMCIALPEAIENLPGREKQILRLRFGLEDGKTKTLKAVGKEFGVTRERIRQIEAKALKKLKFNRHHN